jgi:hypothetical protein
MQFASKTVSNQGHGHRRVSQSLWFGLVLAETTQLRLPRFKTIPIVIFTMHGDGGAAICLHLN